MKFIELALRRNKISQRWHQRPSYSWGPWCSWRVRWIPGRGTGCVRVAGRNIGNILFFQDCGIKYLPRRNKSYVAVRNHLGGNRWIPPEPTILSLLSSSTLGREAIYRGNIRYRRFFCYSVATFGDNNFYVWDRMCTVRVIYDCDVVTLYLFQLFERYINNSNLHSQIFGIKYRNVIIILYLWIKSYLVYNKGDFIV